MLLSSEVCQIEHRVLTPIKTSETGFQEPKRALNTAWLPQSDSRLPVPSSTLLHRGRRLCDGILQRGRTPRWIQQSQVLEVPRTDWG